MSLLCIVMEQIQEVTIVQIFVQIGNKDIWQVTIVQIWQHQLLWKKHNSFIQLYQVFIDEYFPISLPSIWSMIWDEHTKKCLISWSDLHNGSWPTNFEFSYLLSLPCRKPCFVDLVCGLLKGSSFKYWLQCRHQSIFMVYRYLMSLPFTIQPFCIVLFC